jgi:hypothetical protein
MVVVPGLARAASVAELETQESELVPDAALLALAIGTREQVVVDVLPPSLLIHHLRQDQEPSSS